MGLFYGHYDDVTIMLILHSRTGPKLQECWLKGVEAASNLKAKVLPNPPPPPQKKE